MKKSLTLIMLSVFISTSVIGQDFGIKDDDIPKGLEAGDLAPAFEAQTLDKETFSLNDALEENAVALIFYRGFWCPHCSRILSAYADSLSYLTDLGIRIVAVTPETYENVDKTIENTGVPFTILADPDGKIMRLYDVDFRVTDAYNQKIVNIKGASIEEINGTDVAELPIPATYLIVKDAESGKNKIVWRHFDPNYKKRARVLDIRRAFLDAQ